ncbi:tyrosinase family protein [Natronorarus salvus]|uniref:tyrosinase family protein n=1 Tax=Natronorarus salvus TaxID=3117733 RepID=UPI002F26BF57
MTNRKNVRELTRVEKEDFIRAVWALKESGEYAKYVRWHVEGVMNPTLAPGETVPPGTSGANFRNSAHRGPAFLPWHREFLRRFEQDLQSEVPGVMLPYWDWTEDVELSDPASNTFGWSQDLEELIGGDGDPEDNDYVNTGPFAYRPSESDERSWTIIDHDINEIDEGLRRTLGRDRFFERTDVDPLLPSPGSVRGDSSNPGLLEIVPYDRSKRREPDPFQWNASSYPSFRNVLEGFRDEYGDPTPAFHNLVHIWVGGSMSDHTSPNDPVFFLHHCFVDKLWAQWQRKHPRKGYVPASGDDVPPGHGLNDPMRPWNTPADTVTPSNVLDHRSLGYRYTSRRFV